MILDRFLAAWRALRRDRQQPAPAPQACFSCQAFALPAHPAVRRGDRYTDFDFREKSSQGWGTTYQVQRADFDKRLIDAVEAKGVEVAVTMSPYYDFLHLLKHVIEQEKSFDPDRIKRALEGLNGVASSSKADASRTREDRLRDSARADARAFFTASFGFFRAP